MITFLFRTYESGWPLVTIKANKKKNRLYTSKITIEKNCCWQVTTRPDGGEKNKTYNWDYRLDWNKRSYKEKTVVVLTVKIKECHTVILSD